MPSRRVKLLTPHGPETWKVLLRKFTPYEHAKFHGWTEWDKKTIHVDSQQEPEQIVATLLHEAAHVALGRDFSEAPVERIEHNDVVLIAPFIQALED